MTLRGARYGLWSGGGERGAVRILVNNFGEHKYKVSDVTEDEFVGINITRDDKYNYYRDQTRMIDDILSDHQMKNV